MGQTGATRASDNVRPPVAGEVACFAVTSSSARQTVPVAWRWRYVTIQADGANVYLVFGDASVTASDTATSGATQSVLIPNGGALECYLPGSGDAGTVAFAYKTASGTATLRCWPSSPREGGIEGSTPL